MRKGLLWLTALLLPAGPLTAQEPNNLAGVKQPIDRVACWPPLTAQEPNNLAGAPAPPACPELAAGCPAPAFSVEAPCGPPGRLWVNAEYLLWYIKNGPVPPLVSVGPVSSGAILGQGATAVFGPGSDLVNSPRSGARFNAGLWLDEDQTWGLEAGYFFLTPGGNGFSLRGDGSPGSLAIGRPFFNPLANAPDAEAVSFPGTVAGRVGVTSSSSLQGADANLLCNLCCGCNYRVDALAGFLYFNLRERLTVTENLAVLPTVPVLGGTGFDILDRFQTQNNFYGGQVGARAELRWGRLFTDLTGKVGLGSVTETVDISGATRITAATGAVTVQPGGLLTLPTNIGHYSRNRFAVLPQGSLTVGYQLTRNLQAWVGYTFLYCSNVARPGDQIDLVVNPTRLPTNTGGPLNLPPGRPALTFHDSDFWAQGVTFGAELSF